MPYAALDVPSTMSLIERANIATLNRLYLALCLTTPLACDPNESGPTPEPSSADAAQSPNTPDAKTGDAGGSAPDAAPAMTAGDATTTDAGSVSSGQLPTTDYEAALAIAEKGRACGVIGAGYWSWAFFPGQFCATLCLLEASCDDLEAALCDAREVPELERCMQACDEQQDAGEDVLECGDGTTIPSEELCDLVPDCATGEDEQHCEPFRCESGKLTGAWSRCDGYLDCEDGADEAGCALLCGEPRAQVQE